MRVTATLELGRWISARAWLDHPDQAAGLVQARPVRAFASETLDARYAKVRKRGRRLQQRSADELHRLRIAVKKLRYATDFFAGLYDGASAREALKRLAAQQSASQATTLGDLLAGKLGRKEGPKPGDE